jgi:hypothetical protein
MKKFIPKFFEWVLKNFWNIFGVVGVLGTFYFSLFYVPDYIKQISTAKSVVIHESLMDDVQELIFYEQDVDVNDIETLIKGKELSNGANYPFSVSELLIQVQERFMANKFVPLDKRKSLIEKIDSIREKLPTIEQKPEIKNTWNNLLPWLMSGIGVFISLLGAISLFEKFKRDKEIEVDIGSELNDNIIYHRVSSTPMIHVAVVYEKLIGRILKELGVKILDQEKSGPDKPVTGPDYTIRETNGGEFIVECKRYTKLVGLSTIRQFLYQTLEYGKNGIFVTASGLTKRSQEAVDRHNESNADMQVFIAQGTSKESLEAQLKKILSQTASNKANSADAKRRAAD